MAWEHEGQEFDEVVVACRPTRPEEYDAVRRGAWEFVVEQLGGMPPIYPGSIFRSCDSCGVEVAVGPLVQEKLLECEAQGVPAQILCLIDASIPAEHATSVVNLGNPFKRSEEDK